MRRQLTEQDAARESEPTRDFGIGRGHVVLEDGRVASRRQPARIDDVLQRIRNTVQSTERMASHHGCFSVPSRCERSIGRESDKRVVVMIERGDAIDECACQLDRRQGLLADEPRRIGGTEPMKGGHASSRRGW